MSGSRTNSLQIVEYVAFKPVALQIRKLSRQINYLAYFSSILNCHISTQFDNAKFQSYSIWEISCLLHSPIVSLVLSFFFHINNFPRLAYLDQQELIPMLDLPYPIKIYVLNREGQLITLVYLIFTIYLWIQFCVLTQVKLIYLQSWIRLKPS